MKPAPSLLTPQAFFSIWAPFALCQNRTIPFTDLFQGNSGQRGCSLLSPASGCQSCLPAGRGFLALPVLICLFQAERVAGTWQQGEATSCADPKACQRGPGASCHQCNELGRDREMGLLLDSWKPPGLANEKSRREEPSTDFQCRALGKKRHVVMLSSEGVWILSCAGEVQRPSSFLLHTARPEARVISPELRGPTRCKVRRGLSS